jgi:5-dehydro-2-deoxygluconokinase
MTTGYDKPLYVLPFDHPATFSKNMFGWQGPLSTEETAQITALKEVIFDAFKAAVAGGVREQRAGILVDEQFGAGILRDAHRQGIIFAYTVEKSGQDEFDFEYSSDFARHIEQFNPTFAKVLVRYDPEGDKALNRRQTARLKQLSDYLHASGRLFMFELLVPPNAAQLQRLGNDKKAYDIQLRPSLWVGLSTSCRTRESRQTCGRSRALSERKIVKKSSPQPAAMAATRSAASSLAEARTTTKCASG